jgi:hypothetical protein
MDILLEWQRLRRIERLLIEMKALCYKPYKGISYHHPDDTRKTYDLAVKIFEEVPGKFKPDCEGFAKFKKEGEDQ